MPIAMQKVCSGIPLVMNIIKSSFILCTIISIKTMTNKNISKSSLIRRHRVPVAFVCLITADN